MRSVSILLRAAGVSALLVGAQTVAAQTAGQASEPGVVAAEQQAQETTTESGDIIVTAQKRAQNLRDVPIAITVVGNEQLTRQQVTEFTDLKRIAPALEIGAPGQSPGGGAFIRGLGTTIVAGSGEPSASLVIDGVPQGNVPLLNLFDVERVEVLRGPQGTLFGQSVSAGVINISTTTPKLNEFSGRFRAELSDNNVAGSEYSRTVNQLAVNVPLGDQAALRVAGHYDDVDGVSRNLLRGTSSSTQNYGGRARLLVQPSDAVTINLIGEYNHIKGRGGSFFTYRETTSPVLLGVLSRCGVTIGTGNSDNCSIAAATNYEDLYGFSAQGDIDLGGVTFTTISSYRNSESSGTASIDALPLTSPSVPFPNITAGPTPLRQELYSQELRLASNGGGALEWVGGLFYSKYNRRTSVLSTFNLFFFPQPSLTAYKGFANTESLAAFGQGTLRVTDRARLIAGARVTRNTVQATNVTTASQVFSNKRSVTDFSWRLGGQYDLFERSTLYATVSEGFKGQTFDDATVIAQTPVYIKPEIPTAYEIGLKGSLFAGRLGYDLNGFWVDVRNFQAQRCVPDNLRGQICSPQNIAKVTSKGVEASFFGEPIEGLNLNSGVAYIHAVYPDGYLGTDGGILGGKQLVNSPRWKFSVSGEYNVAVSNTFNAFLSADTVYRSRVRFDSAATDRVTFQPHFITGGRVGFRTAQDKVEVALFVKNAFNVHEPQLLFNSPLGASAATATTPARVTTTQVLGENAFRLVGLSAQIRF